MHANLVVYLIVFKGNLQSYEETTDQLELDITDDWYFLHICSLEKQEEIVLEFNASNILCGENRYRRSKY